MNMIAFLLRSAALLAVSFGAACTLPALAIELPGAAPATTQPTPAYKALRLGSILFYPTEEARSAGRRAIDLGRIDAFIAALRTHAGNRPPQFLNEDDRRAARLDAMSLGVALAEFTQAPSTHPRLLLRAAVMLSLADNLDAPGAGELAEARFARLLAKVPDQPEALYEYGVFLTNRGQPEPAIAPLERALAGGESRARWPLAIALAALDRQDEALAQLDALRSTRAAGIYPVEDTAARLRAASAGRQP